MCRLLGDCELAQAGATRQRDRYFIHFTWAPGDVVRQGAEWQLEERFQWLDDSRKLSAVQCLKAEILLSHRHLVVCEDHRGEQTEEWAKCRSPETGCEQDKLVYGPPVCPDL